MKELRLLFNKFLFLLFLIPLQAFTATDQAESFFPDSLNRIILMEPTGDSLEGLPVMKPVPDTSADYTSLSATVDASFLGEFLDIYSIFQLYLFNRGNINKADPAYLALTGNQGGYAKTGFVLSDGIENLVKPYTSYVDVVKGQYISNPASLMSITQLFPHECGHIFLHHLCPEDSIQSNTRSVDMHYFSVITDYSTAFNEGFAEHLENLSRLNEKNDIIKKGIEKDAEKIRSRSPRSKKGFRLDFLYPFRLGYYKAGMVGWYQQYEDLKRYDESLSGDIRFLSADPGFRKTEDRLSYRNAGVEPDRERQRNLVQLHATEGAVSAFFTLLSGSNAANIFCEPEFYRPFLPDTGLLPENPEELFSPLENLFMKYFFVLDKYVTLNYSESSQLNDFIMGYCKEFPGETQVIKGVFNDALGTEYSETLPPPLWLMVKDYKHRMLLIDPFGSITVPLYTFDLNAAEEADLMTLPGFSKEDAAAIIDYRRENGFYTSLEQLASVPGISGEAVSVITSSALDVDYMEKALDGNDSSLSISALVPGPLKYIYSRAAAWFVLFILLWIFMIRRQPVSRPARPVLAGLGYLLLWVIFAAAGLVSLFMPWNHHLTAGLPALLIILISIPVYRKNKTRLLRTTVMMTAMYIVLALSLY